ncbi:MAG: hypothetical protein MI924_19465 [Chloroflexales bacterium]|nr:hypothetical protein [Chloroflexales bacterium]
MGRVRGAPRPTPFQPSPWHTAARAGLRAPHPRAGLVLPPRGRGCARQTTRMWGQWRCGRTVAHAFRRSGRAETGARPSIMRRRVR